VNDKIMIYKRSLNMFIFTSRTRVK